MLSPRVASFCTDGVSRAEDERHPTWRRHILIHSYSSTVHLTKGGIASARYRYFLRDIAILSLCQRLMLRCHFKVLYNDCSSGCQLCYYRSVGTLKLETSKTENNPNRSSENNPTCGASPMGRHCCSRYFT